MDEARVPLLDEAGVFDRYGVKPSTYVDFAILRGDPSDGIPGVPGIGEKTAAALINAFDNLDGVIAAANLEPVKPMTARLANLIREHGEVLRVSQKVATAVRDIPLDYEFLTKSKTRDTKTRDRIAVSWGIERFIPDWL